MTRHINTIPDQNPIINEDSEPIAAVYLPWGELRNKTVMVTGGGGLLDDYSIKATLTVRRTLKLDAKIISVSRRVA